MEASQVEVGKVYLIRHHNEVGLSKVKVLRIEDVSSRRVRYICLKLSTNREIIVKSAAKFRRMAAQIPVMGAL